MFSNITPWFNQLPSPLQCLVVLLGISLLFGFLGFWMMLASENFPEIVRLKGSPLRDSLGCIINLEIYGIIFAVILALLCSPALLLSRVLAVDILLSVPIGFVIGLVLLFAIGGILTKLDRPKAKREPTEAQSADETTGSE